MEDGIISESKPKVRKLESDEEDSYFKCYDKSEGKPVHVDIDKVTNQENKTTLPLLPNKSEGDEIYNDDETRDGDGDFNLRKSSQTFKPLER